MRFQPTAKQWDEFLEMLEDGERYAWIDGHPGYVVTDKGRVISFRMRNRVAEKKQHVNKTTGYVVTSLSTHHGSPSKLGPVHRLMALAFIPRPKGESGYCVRHLDGDKQNNALENLSWGSVQDNSDDDIRHGNTRKGSRHHYAKLTDEKVLEARRRYFEDGDSQTEIAKDMGVTTGSISPAIRGRTWTHVPHHYLEEAG